MGMEHMIKLVRGFSTTPRCLMLKKDYPVWKFYIEADSFDCGDYSFLKNKWHGYDPADDKAQLNFEMYLRLKNILGDKGKKEIEIANVAKWLMKNIMPESFDGQKEESFKAQEEARKAARIEPGLYKKWMEAAAIRTREYEILKKVKTLIIREFQY